MLYIDLINTEHVIKNYLKEHSSLPHKVVTLTVLFIKKGSSLQAWEVKRL